MGKGQIFAYLGDGQYSVILNYKDTDRIDLVIAELENQISIFEGQAAELEDGEQKDQINLKIEALHKMIDWYVRFTPEDPTISAWCADLTEDLTGEVATIEIPGERTQVLIRPGYGGRANFSASRDGQLQPAIAAFPANFFLNLAIFPGWQKYKPTYRIAIIVPETIDYDADTCAIVIQPAFSSQQNLDVNQGDASSIQSEYYEAATPPQWDEFKTNYPTNPLVTNTETAEKPLSVTPELREKIRLINSAVNNGYGYENDKSGKISGDHWDVMDEGDVGDCIACHEEIYTKDGIKRVGDLEVGDLVLSYDFGKKEYIYKSILKIWEKGLLPGIDVGLKNGQSINITKNHPLWVRANQIGGRSKYKISIYEKTYFSDIDLNSWWKRRLPIAKKIPYQIKDVDWLNEDLCFIAGHYLAEGWKECGKVSSSGYELVEHIIPLLRKNEIPFSEYRNNSEVPCIRILKSDFKEFLKTLKSNSFDINLPEFIFHLPEPKLEKILSGFYLGDGHNGNYSFAYPHNNHKQEIYSTSSKKFAEDIQRIGLQLGRSFHIWEQVDHQGAGDKPIFRITYNPNSYFLRDHGYNGISEVGIARTKINEIGLIPMRDFEVEDTHTFIFKNGLIAHQCEDFALTKATRIINELGVDPKYCQIALCYEYQITGSFHAVLQIPTREYGDLILDNRYAGLMPKELLSGVYKWERQLINGDEWAYFGRYKGDVPIEYLDCNAAAFADGDIVIVEMTEQNWDDQKVIGFLSSPRSCSVFFEISSFGSTFFGQTILFNTQSLSYIDGAIKSGGQVHFAGLHSGNKGYAIGGHESETWIELKTNLEYNSTTDAFSSKTNISGEARTHLDGCNLQEAAGFVFGGMKFHEIYNHNPSDEHYAYTYAMDSWAAKTPGTEKWWHTYLAINGYGHAIEGKEHNHRKYYPAANSWSGAQQFAAHFFALDGFTIDGIGYAGLGAWCNIPGYGEETDPFYGIRSPYPENPDFYANYSYKYNHVGDSWSSIANFPVQKCWPMGSTGESGGAGYKFGGFSRVDYGWKYDPLGDSWLTLEDGASRSMGGGFMAGS